MNFAEAGREILDQLKETFSRPDTAKLQKILLLTSVPKSWSMRRTAKFFSTTRTMAHNAKELVENNGILTSPNPKKGKKLPSDVVDEVIDFCLNGTNSSELPGEKGFCISETTGWISSTNPKTSDLLQPE